VPTQAECYGLVFAEAHAFGLPAVSCAVQAVPSIIADGQTGIVQPMDAPAEAYVDRLLPLVHDRAAYRRMAHAAQARYQTLLNWDCFTRHLIEQIEACL
jgi:glycosyltransferase involved in cell wall biosynthesis